MKHGCNNIDKMGEPQNARQPNRPNRTRNAHKLQSQSPNPRLAALTTSTVPSDVQKKRPKKKIKGLLRSEGGRVS